MTLRKKIIDNSVRYVIRADSLQGDKIPKEMNSFKPKTTFNPRKQNKKLLKINYFFFAKILGEGFKTNK